MNTSPNDTFESGNPTIKNHQVKFTNSRDYYNYKYSDTLAHDNNQGAAAINSKYSSNLPLIVKYCPKEWKALYQKKQNIPNREDEQQSWFNFINCIGANFCANTEYPQFKECIMNRGADGPSKDGNNTFDKLVTLSSTAPQFNGDKKQLSKEKQIECLQMMKTCISRVFPSSFVGQ